MHHHVPVAAHAASGTSVCSATSIAVHIEDVHVPTTYGHFYLFGKLGNERCVTPLFSLASFLSCVPPADRGWVVQGMRLPFVHRPGAGRTDAAPERRVRCVKKLLHAT